MLLIILIAIIGLHFYLIGYIIVLGGANEQ